MQLGHMDEAFHRTPELLCGQTTVDAVTSISLRSTANRPLQGVKGERCAFMNARASPSARPLTPRAGPLCTAASITSRSTVDD